MRVRILFLLAVLGACRAGARAPAPVVVAQPHARTPADDEWIANATTVTIADGRTLILGGATTRAALRDGEQLIELAPLPAIRDGATASLLADGRVLVAGGLSSSVDAEDAELAEGTFLWSLDGGFVAGPPLATPRYAHTATVLLDGDVLVIGGDDFGAGSDPTGSAERFVVAEERFRPAGELVVWREHHTATLLPDGRVVVVGGMGASLGTVETIEIWDELRGSFAASGTLANSRLGHTVQVVSPTEIVVRGGLQIRTAHEHSPAFHRELEDEEIILIPPRAPLP